MAFINITTNNQSRSLRNSTTVIDNWIYIPGNTITGDYTKPYAITSLDDFKKLFGDHGVDDSKTFNYVTGVLASGLPVIFQRIVGEYGNTITSTATKASMTLSTTSGTGDEQTTTPQVTIYEKYGGTFGNDLKITIRDTGTAVWVDVYYKYTLIETKKLLAYTTDTTAQQKAAQLIKNINSEDYKFERIEIKIAEGRTAADFVLPEVENKAFEVQGVDVTDSSIKNWIPAYISSMTDKLLWQPKFITSGGYTDPETSTEVPIAKAIKELTLARQDCRGIIDVPSGTPIGEYRDFASKVSYQQLSDSQPIPSLAMYGPWQYMQIGDEQDWMPPSYVFLTVLGNDLLRGGKAYTPKAGLLNGRIYNIIRPEKEMGSSIVDDWQDDTQVDINPIIRMQSGDYVIAGNSTLLIPDSVSGENNAFLESSADLTVIEIRRFVYNIAQELQYQYNSVNAFETFAIRVSKFLDTMRSEGAVYDYEIIDISSDASPRTLSIELNVQLSPTIKNIEIFLNVNYGSIEVTTGGGVN